MAKSPISDRNAPPRGPPSLQRRARDGAASETRPAREQPGCGARSGWRSGGGGPRRRGGDWSQRRRGARSTARLSALASRACHDLAVGSRAWEGRSSCCRSGVLGGRTLHLEVYGGQ